MYINGVLLFIVLNFLDTSHGLRCYACSATTPNSYCEIDPPIVPSGTPVIKCTTGQNLCCIIQRQETNEKLGEVHSLFRGCQSNCSTDNFVNLVGPSYTVYYTYCSQSLCNGGLGNKPLGNEKVTNSSEKQLQDISNTAASAASATMQSFLLLSFLVSACLIQ